MNRKERRSKSKKINVLEELVTIMKQYFPQLINKFEGLTDKRNQSYVKYKMKVIFIVRLMGLMCEIKTMHGLTNQLNTEEAIENIAQISGLELDEIPHCDTICGVDIIIDDINKREYNVLELNSNPGIDMHRWPYEGKNRRIGLDILQLLGFID